VREAPTTGLTASLRVCVPRPARVVLQNGVCIPLNCICILPSRGASPARCCCAFLCDDGRRAPVISPALVNTQTMEHALRSVGGESSAR